MSPLIPPVLLCAIGTWVAYRWGIYPHFDAATFLNFGASVASIASTMLGFMFAALAILVSVNHANLIKEMKARGHYSDLLLTMATGCAFFIACAVCGYALLFGAERPAWFLSIVVGLHTGAAVSVLDVGRKLWLVLSNLRG